LGIPEVRKVLYEDDTVREVTETAYTEKKSVYTRLGCIDKKRFIIFIYLEGYVEAGQTLYARVVDAYDNVIAEKSWTETTPTYKYLRGLWVANAGYVGYLGGHTWSIQAYVTGGTGWLSGIRFDIILTDRELRHWVVRKTYSAPVGTSTYSIYSPHLGDLLAGLIKRIKVTTSTNTSLTRLRVDGYDKYFTVGAGAVGEITFDPLCSLSYRVDLDWENVGTAAETQTVEAEVYG